MGAQSYQLYLLFYFVNKHVFSIKIYLFKSGQKWLQLGYN